MNTFIFNASVFNGAHYFVLLSFGGLMVKTFVFRLSNSSGSPLSPGDFTSTGISIGYIDTRFTVSISVPLQYIGSGFWGFTLDTEQIGSGLVGSMSFLPAPAQGQLIPFVIYPNENFGFSYIGNIRVQ